jgi:acid phosphatase class B
MYIAIHVDDGIIFGENKSQIEKVLNGLQKSFKISKAENPTMYLGMEIKISTEGIWISQENYAKKGT